MLDALGRNYLERMRASALKNRRRNRWLYPLYAFAVTILMCYPVEMFVGSTNDWVGVILAASVLCVLTAAWCWYCNGSWYEGMRRYIAPLLQESRILIQVLDGKQIEPQKMPWWWRPWFTTKASNSAEGSFRKDIRAFFDKYYLYCRANGTSAFPARKYWADGCFICAIFIEFVCLYYFLLRIVPLPSGFPRLIPQLIFSLWFITNECWGCAQFAARFALVTSVADLLLDDAGETAQP